MEDKAAKRRQQADDRKAEAAAEGLIRSRINAEVEKERTQWQEEIAKREYEIAQQFEQKILDAEDKYNALYNKIHGAQFDMTEEGKRVMSEISAPSPDCRRCSKFTTCYIWRTVGQSLRPFIADVTEVNAPFHLHSLAKICDEYDIKKEDNEMPQQDGDISDKEAMMSR